jgi:hypothetical protein
VDSEGIAAIVTAIIARDRKDREQQAKIARLTEERDRLRRIEEAARDENDAVLGLPPAAYAPLAKAADPLRVALSEIESTDEMVAGLPEWTEETP